MARNPLVHVPAATPALVRANQLKRRVVGRVRSFDLLDYPAVPYGPDPAQHLRIWELNDLAPRDGWPAVLLIHGGGWVTGSPEHFEGLGPQLAHMGVLPVAMGYRLAPDHRWPAQLEDVLAALDFLAQQQVDASRVALWGHSAGGHMALMAALARPERVAAVVGFGVPSDLVSLDRDGPEPLGDVFGDLEAASPLGREGSLPPTLLVHGTADRVCSIEQARALAAARREVELLEVPDGDHGLRWPPVAAWRARARARRWLLEKLSPAARGSKWRIRRTR